MKLVGIKRALKNNIMDEENKKIIKLIAIYARVSTARQEEEGTIATQILQINEFAEKNGYKIVEVYKDEGWSGVSIARPDLDRLRVDAKKNMWEAVLFYDPDRLARRYFFQELVIDELKELGIESLFVTMPQSKNSEDDLMFGVRGVFAQYERTKIAERFRIGKVRKAKEGHIIVTEAPYGYNFIKRTPEKQGYLEINEYEASIVKNLFAWVVNEGLTLRAIVRRLQELNIKPRKSIRGVWNTSTLSNLLRNRTYIGEGHYGASYAVIPTNPIKKDKYKKIKKTSRRMKPKEEWINISTPVIIDKEIFERAGQTLKNNFTLCVRNKKNEYLLAGRIYCNCGARRAGEGPQHGKHLYYRCTDRVHSYPLPRKCHEAGLNARIVDKIVWDKIVEFMSSDKLITEEIIKWQRSKKDVSAVSIVPIEDLEKAIVKLKQEEDRYAKAYGAGVISMEQLGKYMDDIKEKKSALNGQIIYLQQQNRHIQDVSLPDRESLKKFCKIAKNMLNYLNFDIKQKIIRGIAEKITGGKESLLVEGCLNLNQDYYVEYKTINRNCWFT
jgi:site-specific DNA recombinase